MSTARRLWQQLPMVVRSRNREAVRAAAAAVFHVVDGAVATLAEGYAVARRDLVRREESLRRELIDDLLRGDSDLETLVERAEPFGLDLARVHQVALAAPNQRLPDADAAISALEAVIFNRLGDRDVLVATTAARCAGTRQCHRDRPDVTGAGSGQRPRVAHAPRTKPAAPRAPLAGRGRSCAPRTVRHRPLLRGGTRGAHHGRAAAGGQTSRPRPGAAALSGAASRPTRDCRPRPGRAQPPFAGPRRRWTLLATLDAYLNAGRVATDSAKRLHLSVRTVSYRLDRIKALTGYDSADPAHQFTLQAAVLGAKALNRPEQQLPSLG